MKSLADMPLSRRSLEVGCSLWLVVIMCSSLACDTQPAVRRVVGTLERDRVELVAEAQEPIVEILVCEGHQVQTGDLLVRLDESRFATQRAQAQAGRDRAAARLAELVRGPRTETLLLNLAFLFLWWKAKTSGFTFGQGDQLSERLFFWLAMLAFSWLGVGLVLFSALSSSMNAS